MSFYVPPHALDWEFPFGGQVLDFVEARKTWARFIRGYFSSIDRRPVSGPPFSLWAFRQLKPYHISNWPYQRALVLHL